MPDVNATPTPRMQRRATGTDTVTVACNLPSGHVLQVHTVERVTQYDRNGRPYEENSATIDLAAGRWVLNGPKLDYARLAAGLVPDYRVIRGSAPDAGYGLTPGVPRDFWERWLEQNARSPLVLNRHVFAAGTEDAAVGQARDYRDLRSGLEGLNPEGDSRVPAGRSIRRYRRDDNRVLPEQADLASEAAQ